ncbi:putative integral membrane protein [Neisseria gonorrhoeae]|uniref:Putative integral membrane protein n=1 Tax=Neisseria gonorrhoeae TaxID=485 RepID=A0A378VWG6_NEIGO|nr:putative integral membrane protein [Neisseria gonorrhoeae]
MPTLPAFRQHLKTITAQGWGTITLWKKHPVRPRTIPWLPLLLAIAIFMQMLDATILNTALPEIAADLNESPPDMQQAVVAYTLTVALLIPLSSYLADKFGTKKVFFGSIAVFMLGSALCAASGSLFELALSRVVQGIGGSMLVPIPRLTILRVYENRSCSTPSIMRSCLH